MICKRKPVSLAVHAALFGTTALGATAPAQTDADDENSGAIEEITVVGSNVRRQSTFQNKQPVQIVGQAEFAKIGASQPSDLLKELTVNTGSRGNDETGGSNGTSQINIRGLGFGSTLTLINGRRAGYSAISDSTGNDFVDINQFPLAMIERIDVLTDGASAIYGSQAVAGVANIVTRKGFAGFEVSVDYRDSINDSSSIGFATGRGFDRGHFNAYGTYYQQSGLHRGDFNFLQQRLNGDGIPGNGSLVSGTGSPGTYFRAIPDGNGGLTRDGATRYGDPDCVAAGGLFRPNEDPGPGGSTDGVTCRLSFFDQVSPIREEERVQVFAEFDYEVTGNLKYTHESHFSRNVATGIVGQSFTGGRSATGGGWVIPGSHPFNFFINDGAGGLTYAGADAFAADPTLQAVDLVGVFRPFGAIAAGDNFGAFEDMYGTQERRTTFNYFRSVNGIELDFSKDWHANVFHTVAINDFNDSEGNTYITDRLAEALLDGSFNPFGSAIVTPNLISPKDGASTAFNEAIDVEQFNSRENNTGKTEENILDIVASGPVMATDFGTISAAVGAQYRDTYQQFTPDSLTAAGEANLNGRLFQLEGDSEVWAVYGEAIIPFNDVAELQVALRHEDYSGSIGSTTDPKVSLRIDPKDWLTVRGSWGTSFQAPTIRQTARAVSQGFIDDPASSGSGPANAVCNDTGISASIPIIVEGSDDLGPQSADSCTLGAVFQFDNLQFSADWFQYDYEGVIAQGTPAQAIVNNDCLDDGIPNDPRVNRDGAGFIQSVTTSFENVDSVKNSGVDVAMRYDLDAGSAGSFVLDSRLSFLTGFSINGVDAAGSRNFANGFGPQPELRANGGVTWLLGDNHSLNATARHVDSYANDQSNNAQIDSYTTVDIQYSMVIPGLLGDNDTVLTIGANNVFDEDPPALRTADASGNIITQADSPIGFINRPGYDDRSGVSLLGRIVYLRLKQSF